MTTYLELGWNDMGWDGMGYVLVHNEAVAVKAYISQMYLLCHSYHEIIRPVKWSQIACGISHLFPCQQVYAPQPFYQNLRVRATWRKFLNVHFAYGFKFERGSVLRR